MPAWFIKDNIKTQNELQSSKPRLTLGPDSSATADSTTIAATTDTKDFKFRISESTYAGLHDATASTLLPDLPSKNSISTIFLRQSTMKYMDGLDVLVQNLAKDLQATFVSVDVSDLQEIARTFQDQEPCLRDDEKDAVVVEKQPHASAVDKSEDSIESADHRGVLILDSASESSDSASERGSSTPSDASSISSLPSEQPKSSQASSTEEVGTGRKVFAQSPFAASDDLTKRYFGTNNADKSNSRSSALRHKAVSAILDAALQKQRPSNTNHKLDTNYASADSGRIFFHLRDTLQIAKQKLGLPSIFAIRDRLKVWQQTSNTRVVLFASASTDNSWISGTEPMGCNEEVCTVCSDYISYEDEKLRKHLCPDASLCSMWYHSLYPEHAAYFDAHGSLLMRTQNERRLKQMLRTSLTDKIDRALLETDYRWNFIHDDARYLPMAKSLLSDVVVDTFKTQLNGRTLRKSCLGMSDVEEVIGRLYPAKLSSPTPPLPLPLPSEKKEEEKTEFEKKLDAIRDTCNDFEKDLFNCVVDPGNIHLFRCPPE